MEHLTLITAIAVLVFGVLGAVLGIINTWRAISRERIKVRIFPYALPITHSCELK